MRAPCPCAGAAVALLLLRAAVVRCFLARGVSYPWGLNGPPKRGRQYIGVPACASAAHAPGRNGTLGCASWPELENAMKIGAARNLRHCKQDPWAAMAQEEFAALGSCTCPMASSRSGSAAALSYRCREGPKVQLTVPAWYGIGSELSAQFKALTHFYDRGIPWLDPVNRRRHCTRPWAPGDITQGECLGVRPLTADDCAARPPPGTGSVAVEMHPPPVQVLAFNLSAHHPVASVAHVPKAYRHRGHFWWTSQLLARLLRPTGETRRWLDGLRRQWGWGIDTRVLAVHVRRGDVCFNPAFKTEVHRGRVCEDLDAYTPHVQRLVSAHGYEAIYLATDDQSVVDRAQARPRELMGVDRVFAIDVNRSVYTEDPLYDRLLERIGVEASRVDTRAFLADVFLMASCDGFVGKFTSNVARLAFALSNAWKGGNCVAPYVSLDSLWCADWGIPSGVSLLTDANFKC